MAVSIIDHFPAIPASDHSYPPSLALIAPLPSSSCSRRAIATRMPSAQTFRLLDWLALGVGVVIMLHRPII